MLYLAAIVVVSSLLGSLHCVGMCGPFAIWAATDERGRTGWSRAFGYHAGRLCTYLTAGLFAGTVGYGLAAGGRFLGVQSSAAVVAGSAMALIGLAKLVRWRRPATAGTGSWAGRWIGKAREYLTALPPAERAFAIGLLTTLLPCGWLYIFVLAAMATGSLSSALVVMIAFWIGTLPALTALAMGFSRIAKTRFAAAIQPATAILLVLCGVFTAMGRATASFEGLTAVAAQSQQEEISGKNNDSDPGNAADRVAEQLRRLGDEPLPCCQVRTNE